MNIYAVATEAGIIFCAHSDAADEALSMFPHAYVEVWDTAEHPYFTVQGVHLTAPEQADE